MSPQIDNTSSLGDVITGVAGWLVTLGTLTMALFPFAIPGIVLVAAAVVPLVVVAGLLAAVGAVPLMAVRALRRRHPD